MKKILIVLIPCLPACAFNSADAGNASSTAASRASALASSPYACVTMRAPNDPSTVSFDAPATVTASGTMRADFVGTDSQADEQQDGDVTVTFNGAHDTPGAGSSAHQAAIKLKELDPCNLIYVAYNINPFTGTAAGQDEVSIKVKRNDLLHTSHDCGANGYTVLKAIRVPVSQAVGPDYTGTVRIKATVKAPTAGGTYNICVSVWGDRETGTLSPIVSGQCYNLHAAPLTSTTWPTWGGILGMRTDNVDASATWRTPATLNAVIQRDDPRWPDDCQSQVTGGGE